MGAGIVFLAATFLGTTFLAEAFLTAVFGAADFLGLAFELAAVLEEVAFLATAFFAVFFAGVIVMWNLQVNLTQNKVFYLAQQPIHIGEYSVYFQETTSTNDALRLLLTQQTLPEGALVYASYQSKGKGQLGNSWESVDGENLLVSVVLYPQVLFADEQVWLNIICCLAVNDTAAHFAKSISVIKWPNDIFIEGKKVAGILIENSLQRNKIKFSLIGIGLNLNQQHFSVDKAASLSRFSGAWVDPKVARLVLCENLNKYYSLLKANKRDFLWEEYHKNLLGKGVAIAFKANGQTFEGEILGIDKKGRLHVLSGGEIKSYANKEIEFIT